MNGINIQTLILNFLCSCKVRTVFGAFHESVCLVFYFVTVCF